MSDVIVFACSKGGPGKTTSAILLATELAAIGQSVVMLDADPNQHVQIWAKNKIPKNVEVVGGITEDSIIDEIDSAKERAKFVVADLEGSKNMCVSYALSCADMVIIPVQPSAFDIHEAINTVRLIRQQEKILKRKIPFRLLLTKTSAVIRSKGTKEIEREIQEAGIPRLSCELFERDAYKILIKEGGGLRDMLDNATTKKAREQITKAIINAEAYAIEVVIAVKTIKEVAA